MAIFSKKILLNNAPLKVISLILGYGLWLIISEQHSHTQWVKVPVCFYAQKETQEIQAPDIIEIALKGKKGDLQTIDIDSLAAHIDASSLKSGSNHITISSQTMFLPNSITVVHYKPANIVIDVHEKISESPPQLENIQIT